MKIVNRVAAAVLAALASAVVFTSYAMLAALGDLGEPVPQILIALPGLVALAFLVAGVVWAIRRRSSPAEPDLPDPEFWAYTARPINTPAPRPRHSATKEQP